MAAGDSQLPPTFRGDDSHAPGLSEDARPKDSRQPSHGAVQVRGLESTSGGLPRACGEQGARTSGVLISWIREEFAQCPEEADEETVGYYCMVWILHLFACVLFPDAMGDSASWMWVHCLSD